MNEDTRDVETEENMVTVVLGGDYERMALQLDSFDLWHEEYVTPMYACIYET